MSVHRTSITFPSRGDALERVVALIARHRQDDYFAYEREEDWFIGLGNQKTLLIDSKGETVTVITGSKGKEISRLVTGCAVSDITREFVVENLKSGSKIFGQAGFNYAAHIRGQNFIPGQWPILSMLVPCIEVTLRRHEITVAGFDTVRVREIHNFISLDPPNFDRTCPGATSFIDTGENPGEYISRVEKALSEISKGHYVKVVPSRAVEIKNKVDMPATLLLGRRGNNPARSFSLSLSGFQATGFSPELVMSLQHGKLTTEPLAGTRSCSGSKVEVERLRRELLNDPKEIVEHVISVKEAIAELSRLCEPHSITIDDFMSVRTRGSVQHLGSRVVGMLSHEKDMWDAFEILFPSITATGIPKHAAIEAIQRLENRPRELYSGAVFMIEDLKTFEAALVLRTVFQDVSGQWIQAGAGVIAQSNSQRELAETCEKLASIAPFVVIDSGS